MHDFTYPRRGGGAQEPQRILGHACTGWGLSWIYLEKPEIEAGTLYMQSR